MSKFGEAPVVSVRRPVTRFVAGVLLVSLAWLLWATFGTTPAGSSEAATTFPPPKLDEPLQPAPSSETAVLAGGCFWGVQAVFQHVKGVNQAISGYSGGTKETAQYRTVSSGRTGHAEAVAVTFDPSVITYGTILQIYFSVAHNPTELDRQGPDEGSQYRSAIFVKDEMQRRVAEAYIGQLTTADVFARPIVTRVDALTGFYTAEPEHQDYATRHPDNLYITYNDLPKLEALKRLFPALNRATPVLVGATSPQG